MANKLNPTGRGKNWRTGIYKYAAQELEAKCAGYLSYCEEGNKKPTWQGLAGALKVTSDTLDKWYKGGNGTADPAISEVLKKTADIMSDKLQQRTDSMSIFLLKNPKYGGFTDRPDMASSGLIAINVSFGNADEKIVAEYGK